MDPNVTAALITVVGGGIFVSGGGWLFRNLYKQKDDQIAALMERLEEQERKCERLRQEKDAMFKDWMADVRKTQALADAYLAIRERDNA